MAARADTCICGHDRWIHEAERRIDLPSPSPTLPRRRTYRGKCLFVNASANIKCCPLGCLKFKPKGPSGYHDTRRR